MHKQTYNLRKKKKGVKNDLLVDGFVYTGEHKDPVRINFVQYDGLSGLSDTALISRIGKMLKMHSTDIQDILTSQHIAKIEQYSDKTILVVNTFYYTDQKELQQEHICVILGKDYVVSFQESELPLFNNIITAIERNTALVRTHTVDYLFFLLMNNILGNYLDVIAALEEELEKMEDEVLTRDPREDFGNRIQANRRDYMQLKKSILPLKDDCNKLIHNENKLIKEENMVYLNDLEDRIVFIIQSIEICRESMASLLDLYDNDMRMNGIMKQLTIVATIFIPLTFVVGVWGMNFKIMPELEWKYGYLMAWALMILVVLIVWWFIKRRRWN